jgi:protein gp37
VIGVAKATPQHTHIFCTKNPLRYSAYNPWPSNCWLLTTITNQQDADERIPELLRAQAPVRGVSLEPLLGPVDFIKHWGLPFERQGSSILRGHPLLRRLQWLIIGAMTGPGYMQHLPKREWIQNLINQARDAGVPLFIKDNVNWREKTQEAEKWMSVPPARSCII